MLSVERTTKADSDLRRFMVIHYSQPKGFVGRQLFYRLTYAGVLYGCIAFGSATRFLPGRALSFPLNNGLNNIFYHIEKVEGRYPHHDFTTACLLKAEVIAQRDYQQRYGDEVLWLETLVEYPRTGLLYQKAGYIHVGDTKGYTCKRVAGKGTDSWGGRRVWDKVNLRPKKVFLKVLQPSIMNAS